MIIILKLHFSKILNMLKLLIFSIILIINYYKYYIYSHSLHSIFYYHHYCALITADRGNNNIYQTFNYYSIIISPILPIPSPLPIYLSPFLSPLLLSKKLSSNDSTTIHFVSSTISPNLS